MIKVMIVEDDPMVCEINKKFLAKVDGFELSTTAKTLEEAKVKIKNDVPDLILLDIFFPNGKGIDLIKWLRREGFSSDVIFITADNNTETFEEAFRYGAVDYIIKPFVLDRFKTALNKYASRRLHLRNNDEIDQSLVDRYVYQDLQAKTETSNRIMMKGFSQHTFDKVNEAIESWEKETFTAEEIAKEIGVSRITARRYLDYLEREGKLEIEFEYGKVGRPQNKYKLKK
jgi:response regulator of citrate/malate metabolism